MNRFRVLLTASFFVVSSAGAQSLTTNLSAVSDEYSRLYVAPLIDAYGANINAGLFQTAKIGGGLIPKIDLYLGVKVFGAMLPSDRSLSLAYETEEVYVDGNGTRYVVPVTYNIEGAPTVFGETEAGEVSVTVNEMVDAGLDGVPGTADDVVIDDVVSMQLLPGLVNTPVAPLVIPQIGIGSFAGTDVLVRFLPTVNTESYGSISFKGFGVRHSISQYFPLFPADISAQFVYQRLTIDDGADNRTLGASAYAGNVAISKSLPVVTVYGGLQIEKTKVDVNYVFDSGQPELGSQTINFSQQAKNRFRALAGISLTPGPIQINFDYALGSLNTVSAGIGIML